MKTKQFKNISLIIIDQLKADYARYFEKCSKLLPYQAVCDTASIPASTEAMHANISFGVYPKEHGMIFRSTRDEDDGLRQIIKKMSEETVMPLASIALKHGYKPYLIGGKLETIRVMGNPKECSLFLQYNKRSCFLEGTDEGIITQVGTELGAIQNKEHFNLDAILLDLYKSIISTQKNCFAILTLPILDFLGHKFGANSPEVIQHIRYLDDALQKTIEKTIDNTVFIVTGDHGCRNTTRYVIESDERDPRIVKIYKQKGELLVPCETYFLDNKRNLINIKYDGGVLRIWTKNNTLSVEDTQFLSTYGTIFSDTYDYHVNGKLHNLVKKSRHENLGDIFVVAYPDTTFCKRIWIKPSVFEKVINGVTITRNEAPIGEHGTYYKEDRDVYFMSNYDFQTSGLKNVMIRTYLENLMEFNSDDRK